MRSVSTAGQGLTRARGQNQRTVPIRNPLVGTGGFEPPTPTVSRQSAATAAPASLIENDGDKGSDMGKEGTDGGLSTHGVLIASLARDVLCDTDATVREAALAGWILHDLRSIYSSH